MNAFISLTGRNVKLFFKDKGMFFTSLATPIILLVLYATFLGNVYTDSFMSFFPEGVEAPSKIIDVCVAGQLMSSLLAVCCITVPFCSNMLMVQDKVSGSINDLTITPVKGHVMALSYYIATLFSSLIICVIAAIACMCYVAGQGWYMSGADVMLTLLQVFLMVMFGTALSSVINFFLKTQGQISAVGSVVSAGYGFICGAYMPISQFSDGLQKVLSFFPGTYGTVLFRTFAMRGPFEELAVDYPVEMIDAMKKMVDYKAYFFEKEVTVPAMFAIMAVTVTVLLVIYILLNVFKGKKAKKSI